MSVSSSMSVLLLRLRPGWQSRRAWGPDCWSFRRAFEPGRWYIGYDRHGGRGRGSRGAVQADPVSPSFLGLDLLGGPVRADPVSPSFLGLNLLGGTVRADPVSPSFLGLDL